MAVEKRKHKTKVLNEKIFNELIKNEKDNLDKPIEPIPRDIQESPAFETQGGQINLNAVVDHYHKKLNDKTINWLNAHGITDHVLYETYQIGFADGSLLEITGDNQKKELIQLGILKDNYYEHFNNCITIPVFGESGQVIQMHGINITTDKFIQPIKLLESMQMFNRRVIKVYDEVILTEDFLDALSLIQLDIKNVISISRHDEFKAEYIKILQDNRVKTLIIAFKNEVSSVFSCDIVKDLLLSEGFNVKSITLPHKDKLTKEYIEVLINTESLITPDQEDSLIVKKDTFGYVFLINDITYKVSNVKEIFGNNLKVNIRLEFNNEWFPDNVDLYASRSREAFSLKISQKFNVESKRIEKDLLSIFDYLDNERKKRLKEDKNEKQELTEEEIKLGMLFLNSPNLFQEIIDDMTTLGYVGEDLNKLLMYLCATSRLMDDPISVMIVSQSASGKSYLVDTTARLMPENEVIDFHTLSKQALQYMKDKLLNKFMLMGEATHDPDIENQLRQILSGHKLSRYVVVKNEKTGEMTTENVRVNAVVSSVLTTTSNKINPENASRYFIVNTDESKEQTRLIYEAQKQKYSEEREKVKKNVIPDIIKKHQCAQRLLKKTTIVIPSKMRNRLKFPDKIMRLRRDFERFIDLIAVVCFLRQYQKDIKSNKEFEYIECDKTDYRIAYNILINDVLSSTISEIPQQSVMVYEAIREIARENAEAENLKSIDVGVSQREIREYTGFNQMFVKRYIKILVDYEYLKLKAGGSRGSRHEYTLIKDEVLNHVDISMIPSPDLMDRMLDGKEE